MGVQPESMTIQPDGSVYIAPEDLMTDEELAAAMCGGGLAGPAAQVVEFKAVAVDHASERRATQGSASQGTATKDQTGSESRGTQPWEGKSTVRAEQLKLDAIYEAQEAVRLAESAANRASVGREAEYIALLERHARELDAFAKGGAA